MPAREGGAARTGAGVRKPPMEETAGGVARWRVRCQSALKFDPVSASNFDPFERRGLAVALASSELAGIAETWRARVA